MITIDPDVFGTYGEYGLAHEVFVVTGTLDMAATTAVLLALERAAFRFMRVGEDGVERHDDEASGLGIYTPNYVSDPRVTEQGVVQYVDCKGEIGSPMDAALRRVLQEELGGLDVDARVSVVTDQLS